MLISIATPQISETKRKRSVLESVERVIEDAQAGQFRKLDMPTLTGILESLFAHLENYLGGQDDAIAKCRDFIANTCFRLSIPLLETTYVLYLISEVVGDQFVNRDPEQSARTTKFFDVLVLELLERY